MGTRTDGADNLFRLRRGEDEDNMLRWFLNHLQQGISAGGGNHVRLIDDEDAIARFGWRVVGAIAQFTHVLHTIVGGRVKLCHVQVAGAARG